MALSTRHEIRIHHILSVSIPALENFFTLSHKRYKFRNKLSDHKICSDFLYNFSQQYFSLQKTEIDTFKNENWFLCNLTFIFVRF